MVFLGWNICLRDNIECCIIIYIYRERDEKFVGEYKDEIGWNKVEDENYFLIVLIIGGGILEKFRLLVLSGAFFVFLFYLSLESFIKTIGTVYKKYKISRLHFLSFFPNSLFRFRNSIKLKEKSAFPRHSQLNF